MVSDGKIFLFSPFVCVAFETNRNRQFLNVVAPFLPQNAQQAHARLAITVFAERYDHTWALAM
jgi:hypothetical protein